MTTALTQQPKDKAVTVRSLVSAPAMQARFKEVLKDKSEQFVSSLINISNSMKDVEPHSIIQSAMVAAALDLPIDKNLGFAWIVPFKNKGVKMAQFQMGFKGFIQLALRSGQYKRMNARAINAEALDGFDDVGEPRINWQKIDETKPISGFVFAFQLVNGFTKCAYWSQQRVEEHAKRYSQSFRGGYDSPWKTHFSEMALKTVIKNELPKWGIMSIQMQQAVEKDQGVIDVDGNVEFLDNTPEVKSPDFGDMPLPEPPKIAQGTPAPTERKRRTPAPPPAEPSNEGDLAPTVEAEAEKSFEEVVDGADPAEQPNPLGKLQAAIASAKIDENYAIAESKTVAYFAAHNLLQEGQPKVLRSVIPGKIESIIKMLPHMAGQIKEMGA